MVTFTPDMSGPPGRRRHASRDPLLKSILSSWKVFVFLGVIVVTCLNMHNLLSSQHRQHVEGGIKVTQQQQQQQQQHVTGSRKGLDSAKLRADASLKQLEADSGRQCHTQQHTEYDGEVVKWGSEHLKDSADLCCSACKIDDACNTWVWCTDPNGCGDQRRHKECWLKRQRQLNVLHPAIASEGPNCRWTSGAIYSDSQRQAALERISAQEKAEADRLLALKTNQSLPLVYLDVEIKGEYQGRIEFVLFTDVAPRWAENFRQLCTGEKGVVPKDGTGREGEGLPYHFKGKYFYRIIDRFIDQTGADVESVYGRRFKDDPGGLKLKHDRKGLLSAANQGPDTNTSHFSILQAPAPHLNGHYTIFGELVSGWEVAAKINALSRGKPDNTAGREAGAKIIASGQLRRGDPNLLPEELRHA